jgi:hypothetical protein
MVLVQTKIDLKDDQAFTDDELNELVTKVGAKLFLTCSKENINVSEVFEHLGNVYLTEKEKGKNNKEESKSQGPVASIKDIKSTNTDKSKTITLKAHSQQDDKKKKKGAFGWCSVL